MKLTITFTISQNTSKYGLTKTQSCTTETRKPKLTETELDNELDAIVMDRNKNAYANKYRDVHATNLSTKKQIIKRMERFA